MDVTSNASISPRRLLPPRDNRSTGTAAWILLSTSAGTFSGRFTRHGLAELNFPDSQGDAIPAADAPADLMEWVGITHPALETAVQGRAVKRFPPFDWSGATEFQQLVWSALCRIPCGATATYGSIAREIGSPGAARAIGAACGANPIPVLVPCHRVLASGGTLGGFSGGLDWKRRLLAAEAAAASFHLRG